MQDASADRARLERLRWRTVFLIFCAAAFAMLLQVLLNLGRYEQPVLPPVISMAALAFAALAVWQISLRRVSVTVERAGLFVTLTVYLLHYVRQVAGVFSGDLQGDSLVEIISWSGVVYTAMFFFFPIRRAVILSALVLLFSSSYWAYFVFQVGMPGNARFGINALLDMSMSGLVIILLLSILKRVTDAFARTQARARAMEELANVDSLTGLYNRRYLNHVLENEFQRAKRYAHPLSISLCDIDNFKTINDKLSHAVGDETLKAFADLLGQTTREVDIVARYGGEEFVIIFVETTQAQAALACEKIRAAIETFDWFTIHPDLQVTASFGVTDDISVAGYEAMLSAADLQLYRAKHSGKNQVRV